MAGPSDGYIPRCGSKSIHKTINEREGEGIQPGLKTKEAGAGRSGEGDYGVLGSAISGGGRLKVQRNSFEEPRVQR
jgi:hypothetical protein